MLPSAVLKVKASATAAEKLIPHGITQGVREVATLPERVGQSWVTPQESPTKPGRRTMVIGRCSGGAGGGGVEGDVEGGLWELVC